MNYRLAVVWTLLCSSAALCESANAILSRMDQAAPAFHAATADVTMDSFESILNDHTVEKGTLQMQRKGSDVRAIVAFTGANTARTIAFQGEKIIMYFPMAKTAQEYDAGSNSQLVNQFLLLGFGTSGKDLSAAYTISEGGTVALGGENTTKLVLVPKAASTRETLAKVEIWVAPGKAYPAQQEFYLANGNTRTTTYANVKINPPMSGPLELKLPKGTQKTKEKG